ncbi:hypothetical protein C7212DRAFT_364606 [Tuber magnatum]|uniref:Uncharacterized protein n=1 Tax=Tuber magnatum TaxID=42249 RepID=A0A317SMP8_9PEZI|nr:hypothetical protein C7212DRAFT_364606 [Tuber magnatum]
MTKPLGQQSDSGEQQGSAGDRMCQVTHSSQEVYTDNGKSIILNFAEANPAARGWAEGQKQARECKDEDRGAASDGVERDGMENAIPGITEHLLHFLSDTRELLEVRLREQDGRLDNIHSVASQALLGTHALEIGQQSLLSRLDTLGSNMSPLSWGLRALGPRIAELGHKVDALDSKVDVLISEMHALDYKANANQRQAMAMFEQVLASTKLNLMAVSSVLYLGPVWDAGIQGMAHMFKLLLACTGRGTNGYPLVDERWMYWQGI